MVAKSISHKLRSPEMMGLPCVLPTNTPIVSRCERIEGLGALRVRRLRRRRLVLSKSVLLLADLSGSISSCDFALGAFFFLGGGEAASDFLLMG